MDYYGIGFSNIRLPNDSKSYIYKYDSRINAFPEEVFLHEFLHSLERNAQEYGYDRPELHAYQEYGYKNEKLIGQKVVLPKEIYTLKPAKNNEFNYSYEMQVFKQPENIIEEIREIIENLISKVKILTQ